MASAPPTHKTPDPFSFPPKTDAYGTNVYYLDFQITGLEPFTPFKLFATHMGVAGIANPLNAGQENISSGNWQEDQEIMTNRYGELAVRIRNMAPTTVGDTASVQFILRDAGGSNAILASKTWSVTTAKPSIPRGGYFGDKTGPTGIIGRDAWTPQ